MVLMNADQCRGLELERRADGQLWARLDNEERAVRVHRCFPWSEPGRFLSLRDTDDDEFVLVSSIDDLDGGTRRVLEGAVAEAGFVLEVTRIDGGRSTPDRVHGHSRLVSTTGRPRCRAAAS